MEINISSYDKALKAKKSIFCYTHYMKDIKQMRYSQFLKEAQVRHTVVSYNDLTAKEGQKPNAHIRLRPIDTYRLIQPYVSVRFLEQLYALLPLSLYLVLFQLIILRQNIVDATTITVGLFAVLMGLMFFMEGIKQGLMPFGEVMGNTLPKKVSLSLVLLVSFILGIGVTFAEPAIGALKAAGSLVDLHKAPYLYALLNLFSGYLILIVGMGVGLAAVLGTLRFLHGWSLKPFIYVTLIPIIILTAYMMTLPELAKVLGLAWDSGAVTTGPVTVPLVLSLGIGIAAASGKGNSSLSGFGIVTLASLFPIMGVMILSISIYLLYTPLEIITLVQTTLETSKSVPSWYETTPGQEVIAGIQAIIPLSLFLFFVMKLILKQKINNAGTITYGITLSVIGMIVFNIGLTYGLSKLGDQSGSIIPVAFSTLHLADGTIMHALYPYALGLFIAIGFAWILGFGATLAEPALNALGMTVEKLTQGVFKKRTLMIAVSVGVAFGLSVGITKVIFDIPLGLLLIPLYIIAAILTYFSSEAFVNIAWDSAGVTTGPITVPLVLAMGLGFGGAMDAIEGFGILSMASIFPILCVLSTGLWVNRKIRKQELQGE